ncbi:MAG TPA: LemA family protein [candidate division Zixibacteria bacterium]|jgi:LemA protein
MLGLLIIVGLIVALILWVVSIYNGLVKLRVGSENAWSDIDVQLKRRYELIPNLVETVKGYATHERKTFEDVTAARTRAMAAQGPAEKAQAEGMLTSALKSLFAVAEAYPELRATENFQQLQKSLNELEDYIQSARRYYNAVVRDLNTRIQQFPSNLVARQFGFTEREFFELGAEAERTVPKVDFGVGAA